VWKITPSMAARPPRTAAAILIASQARLASGCSEVGPPSELIDALIGNARRLLDQLRDEVLVLIAGQDVEPGEGSDGSYGRWRLAHRVAADQLISVCMTPTHATCQMAW
jgi:hypothetical protein